MYRPFPAPGRRLPSETVHRAHPVRPAQKSCLKLHRWTVRPADSVAFSLKPNIARPSTTWTRWDLCCQPFWTVCRRAILAFALPGTGHPPVMCHRRVSHMPDSWDRAATGLAYSIRPAATRTRSRPVSPTRTPTPLPSFKYKCVDGCFQACGVQWCAAGCCVTWN